MKNKYPYSGFQKTCINCSSLLVFLISTIKFINLVQRTESLLPIDYILLYLLCCTVAYAAIRKTRIGLYLLIILLFMFGTALLFLIYFPSDLEKALGIVCYLDALIVCGVVAVSALKLKTADQNSVIDSNNVIK